MLLPLPKFNKILRLEGSVVTIQILPGNCKGTTYSGVFTQRFQGSKEKQLYCSWDGVPVSGNGTIEQVIGGH